jgi:DNA sulfur modification protein DndD
VKIKKIKIENFGSFQGVNEFNLLPESYERPIILIGGKNGAGKSTFFEAIKCCLFGKRSRGHKIREIDYLEYLEKRRSFNISADTPTEIEITLEFVNLGNVEEYIISRRWTINDKENVNEIFTIEKDQVIFNDIPKESWQEFIIEILPPHIIDLFFFDSEDLQSLAINSETNAFLYSAVKKLLGLHYVDQLIKDLDHQLINLNQSKSESLKNSYNSITQEIVTIEKQYEEKVQQKAVLNTKIKQLTMDIDKFEVELANLGKHYADKRVSNKDAKVKLETEIEYLENQVKNHSAQLLPFLIVETSIDDLLLELAKEEEQKALKKYSKFIQKVTAPQSLFTEKLKELGLKVDNNTLEQIKDSLIPRIFDYQVKYDITEKEYLKIESYSNQIKTNVKSDLIDIFANLKKKKLELQKIQAELDKAPEDSELKQIFNMMKKKIEDREVQSSELQGVSKELAELDTQLKSKTKEIEKLKKLVVTDAVDIKKRILGVQDVLGMFNETVKNRKIELLEDQILSNFKLICRKGEIIKSMEINPDNFGINLIDINGTSWDRKFLSEGEKQLLALSILWALTQITGKNYPFIIDTPLGRLDEEHRNGLISDFFGKATEQIIILSTNEEFDFDLYNQIKPLISSVYLLEYDYHNLKTITRKNNYFFEKEVMIKEV